MDLHQHVFRVPDGVLLSLGLSWSFVGKCPADLDLAAVSFGKNGRFLDVVFFNHTMAGKSDAEAQKLRQQYDFNVKDLPYMLLSGDSRTGGEAENRVMSWKEMTQKSSTSSFPRTFSSLGNGKRGKNGTQRRETQDGSWCHTSKVKDDILYWEQEEWARRAGGGVEPQRRGKKSDDPLLSHTFSQQERELYRELSAADGRLQQLLHTHPDSFSRRHPTSLSDESILFHVGKIPAEAECIFVCVTSYTGIDFSQLAEVRLDVYEELPSLSSEEWTLLEDGVAAPLHEATAPRRRRRLGMFDLKSSTGNGTANLCACLVRVPNDSGNNGPFFPFTPADNRKVKNRSPADPSLLIDPHTTADALLTTTPHAFISPSILRGLEGSQNPLPLCSRLWDLREVNIRAMGYTFVDLLPVMLNLQGIPAPSHLETLRIVPNYALRKVPRTSLPLLPSAAGGTSFASCFLPVLSPSSVLPTSRESNPNTVEHLRQQLADLRFGIGWDGSVDVDAFCIVLDKKNKYLTHFHPKFCPRIGASAEILWNAPRGGKEGGMERWESYPCRHSGDCTSGRGFTGDGESIDLLIHMLPAEAHVLVLGATLVSTSQDGKSGSIAMASTSKTTAKTNAFSAFSTFSTSSSSPPPTISGMPIVSPCQGSAYYGGRSGGSGSRPLPAEHEAVRSIVEVPGLYMRLQNRPLFCPHAEEIDRWDVFRDISLSSLEDRASQRGGGRVTPSGASTPIGVSIAAEEEVLAPRRVAYAANIRAHTLLFGALWNFSADDWTALSSLLHSGKKCIPPPATLYDPAVAGGGPPRTEGVETSPSLPTSLFPSLSRPFPSGRAFDGSSRQTLEEEERRARRRLTKPSPTGTATPLLPSSQRAVTPPTTSSVSASAGGTADVPYDAMGDAGPRIANEASSIFTYFPLRQVVPVDETLSFSGIISYTESLLMLANRVRKMAKKRMGEEKNETPRGMGEELYRWGGGSRDERIGRGYPTDSSSPSHAGATPFHGIEATTPDRFVSPLRSASGMLPQTTTTAVAAAASSLLAGNSPAVHSARPTSARASFLSPLPSVWCFTEAVAAAGWGGGSMVMPRQCASNGKGALEIMANSIDPMAQSVSVPRLLFSSHSMFPSPFGIVLQFIEVTTLSPHLPGESCCIGEAWVCGAGPERLSAVAASNFRQWKRQKSQTTCPPPENGYGKSLQGMALQEVGGWMNVPFQTSFQMEERAIGPSSVGHHRRTEKKSRGIRGEEGGERSPDGVGAESELLWTSPSSRPLSSSSASVVAPSPLADEGDQLFCSVGRPGQAFSANRNLHTHGLHDSGRNTDVHRSLRHSILRNAKRNEGGDRACFVVYPYDSICILLHSRAAFGVGKIHLYPLQDQLFRATSGSAGGDGSSRLGASSPHSLQNSYDSLADGRTRMQINASNEPSRFLPYENEMRHENEVEDDMYDDGKVEWRGGKPGSSVQVVVSLQTPGDEECIPLTRDVISPSGMQDDGNTDAHHTPSSATIVPARTQAVVKVRITCIRLEECAESLKTQLKWAERNEAKHRARQINQFNNKQRKSFKWF